MSRTAEFDAGQFHQTTVHEPSPEEEMQQQRTVTWEREFAASRNQTLTKWEMESARQRGFHLPD